MTNRFEGNFVVATPADVSAVVCSWNAVESIEACLVSLRENGVGEIIVVDAASSDGTTKVAERIADVVLTDPRDGLAKARNIGIEKTRYSYVLNVGVDNVMPIGSIQKMLDCLLQNGYAGVSAVTLMVDIKKNYYSWAMNLYKLARYFPGERTVIGTPTLFPAMILKKYPYDDQMSWSDDGDLCSRLGEIGYLFAIADVEVYETGSESFASVLTRWRGYGKSDWETYSKYSPAWSFPRRVKSFLYPFRNELLLPFLRIRGIRRFGALPFLMLITFLRYRSWLVYSISARKTVWK
jgi:glycosyltransferase involved in cell wall biosynthesis